MNEATSPTEAFVETLEYRRFAEFCDACRQYRYIGLCYGSPGVGKTLSARHYADWDQLSGIDVDELSEAELQALKSPDTVFYTTEVVNTPRNTRDGINRGKSLLNRIARRPLHREYRAIIDEWRTEFERKLQNRELRRLTYERDPPTYEKLPREYAKKNAAIPEPTKLILIDEADRLKMASLEVTRDIFDRHHIGLILIGMPGIEKRMARYPQFYSRIGFVHEFRPLGVAEVYRLLDKHWRPPGVTLGPIDEESATVIARITGGNFRLLHRLLAQVERVTRINQLDVITPQVIETARESLVIGQM